MPTKDFQADYAEHIRMILEVRVHAAQAQALLKSGDVAGAKSELAKADEWLAKADVIAKKFKLRNPHTD
jgi:hypothetical protein